MARDGWFLWNRLMILSYFYGRKWSKKLEFTPTTFLGEWIDDRRWPSSIFWCTIHLLKKIGAVKHVVFELFSMPLPFDHGTYAGKTTWFSWVDEHHKKHQLGEKTSRGGLWVGPRSRSASHEHGYKSLKISPEINHFYYGKVRKIHQSTRHSTSQAATEALPTLKAIQNFRVKK